MRSWGGGKLLEKSDLKNIRQTNEISLQVKGKKKLKHQRAWTPKVETARSKKVKRPYQNENRVLPLRKKTGQKGERG